MSSIFGDLFMILFHNFVFFDIFFGIFSEFQLYRSQPLTHLSNELKKCHEIKIKNRKKIEERLIKMSKTSGIWFTIDKNETRKFGFFYFARRPFVSPTAARAARTQASTPTPLQGGINFPAAHPTNLTV